MTTKSITRSCGHSTDEYLCYNGAARKAEIAAIAAQPCKSCAFKAQLAAKQPVAAAPQAPAAPRSEPLKVRLAEHAAGQDRVTATQVTSERGVSYYAACTCGHNYDAPTAEQVIRDATEHASYHTSGAYDRPNRPAFSETAAWREATGFDRD